MSRRGSLTETERKARRHADRERLEQAARQLLTSEGWKRWVKVRSTNGLARYSFHNQLLIAHQNPDATYVAGFRAFLALNRCVRKGEKAIRSSPRSASAPAKQSPPRQGNPRKPTGAPSSAPSRCSTSLKPTRCPARAGTARPPEQPVDGDSHAHLLESLIALAGELGYTVSREPLRGSADGWCDARSKRIVVSTLLPANGQVRVLVHEIAHALGIGYRDHGREQAEVLVDTVTCIVCGSVGLDISGSSVPYIAGWGENGKLDAIRAYAETIDAVARRIEAALDPCTEPTRQQLATCLACLPQQREQAQLASRLLCTGAGQPHNYLPA